MGASRVDLNSQDSVVPASEPRESSRFEAFQPSSEYWEDEDDEGKSRRWSRGGRSDDVRSGGGSGSPHVKGRDLRSPPLIGSVITPSYSTTTNVTF